MRNALARDVCLAGCFPARSERGLISSSRCCRTSYNGTACHHLPAAAFLTTLRALHYTSSPYLPRSTFCCLRLLSFWFSCLQKRRGKAALRKTAGFCTHCLSPGRYVVFRTRFSALVVPSARLFGSHLTRLLPAGSAAAALSYSAVYLCFLCLPLRELGSAGS